jgi:hypothetical protein
MAEPEISVASLEVQLAGALADFHKSEIALTAAAQELTDYRVTHRVPLLALTPSGTTFIPGPAPNDAELVALEEKCRAALRFRNECLGRWAALKTASTPKEKSCHPIF